MMHREQWIQRRHGHLLLPAIVLLGMALRLLALVGFQHTPESDELAYQSMALGLVHGQAMVDNMGNYAMYNVGYPLFVLAPAWAVFGESVWVARLANLALGGLSIVLCYTLAKEAGAARLGRLAAPAAWALYLPASVYGVYLAKENLVIPLVLGLLCCALRLLHKPNWSPALGCGLLLGLLALSGNAALSLAAAVLLALAWSALALPRKCAWGLAMVLLAVLVTAPWLERNARLLGAPVLNTNGGFNFYTGNNPAATGWYMSIAETPRGASWNSLRKLGEVQASEVLKREAMDWIAQHPAAFLSLAASKGMYFWMPPWHAGKGPGSGIETLVRVLWSLQYGVLAALAVASLGLRPLQPWRSRLTAVLWLALASYTAVHMLFFVSFRYREAIMPLLVVIAALALEALVAKTTNPPRVKTPTRPRWSYAPESHSDGDSAQSAR